MSKKGGYLIIDLENINITDNSSKHWVIECDNATSSQLFTLYYVGY